jgi:hypothetical protein
MGVAVNLSLYSSQAMKGYTMTSKKKNIIAMPRKIYWHLYSLQTLNSEKFIRVVDKVLKQEYQLIK